MRSYSDEKTNGDDYKSFNLLRNGDLTLTFIDKFLQIMDQFKEIRLFNEYCCECKATHHQDGRHVNIHSVLEKRIGFKHKKYNAQNDSRTEHNNCYR